MATNQANVEYFFRLLYDLFFGHSGVNFDAFTAFLTQLWLVIVYIGYALSVIALVLIVYILIRLFELREREAEYYGTVIATEVAGPGNNPRWLHIESLMESDRSADWREAITEADIMLDEMLTRQNYTGEGVGDKLKNVEPSDFDSLQDAWEAHKVRNQIAHQGSLFDLSQDLARRTIARYEKVFREFEFI